MRKNRYVMRIRSLVVKCMIDRRYCEEYDPVMARAVPQIVLERNSMYVCPFCKRLFEKEYSIYQHILQSHGDIVDYYYNKYMVTKYRLLGWL